MSKYQHQKDLNGCGIACIANLLSLEYDIVKDSFEKRFYSIGKGVKVFDMATFLMEQTKCEYKAKFFNQKNFDTSLAKSNSENLGSITLIYRNEKYPVGHYLLRVENGWVDPWINYPSIDDVHAGIRSCLPGNVWYVVDIRN